MAQDISYKNCIESLYSLGRFGIKLGLSAIGGALENLGNPHHSFKSVHVAGTNGKGSIASLLALIFYKAGYKVGLYTSPHLVHFNERICVNNQFISDEDVIASYNAVQNAHHGERELTFFEYATAMAFYEFARQKVDWAIIETGMGGRLDATNIIKPELSIISNVSIEHQTYLGNTVAKIAYEKGGIIKEYSPVVTGVAQKKAISVLQDIAKAKSAPFYHFGNAFKIEKNSDGTFSYFGINNIWRNLTTGMLGEHQINNAALVLATCEILNENKISLSLKNIKEGLAQNNWRGRLEIISENPFILLDGAHNLSAAHNLAKFLATHLANRKITLVIGILDDKPYSAMLRCLLPICNKVILTSANTDRAIPPEKLHIVAKKIIPDAMCTSNVEEAVKYAIKITSSDGAICVAGSLYVVGEARKMLCDEKKTGLTYRNIV